MQILAAHGVIGLGNEAWIANGRIADHVRESWATVNSAAGTKANLESDPAYVGRLQTLAQQLLLLDRTIEAGELFHQVTKCTQGCPRAEQQARACLTTGLQSLHRYQVRTAWNCLQRTLDSRAAPRALTAQAQAAMAALYFGLGMRRPAMAAVDCALSMLDTAVPDQRLPIAMLHALRAEFFVLDIIRQHDRLDDLVFWPRHEEVAGSRMGLAQVRNVLGAARSESAGYAFIAERLDFLAALLDLAYGAESTIDQFALAHLQHLQEQGLMIHLHSARHELALACIAGRRTELLRQVMLAYVGTSRNVPEVEHNLEHRYCLAKLGELSGRDEVYIAHYRAYTSRALVHLRQTCAYITVPSTLRQAAAEIPKDDIASRLSGRYRRAYQFMVANLHRSDLSIREVADEIGVTERALQLAFRDALGMSPSAVVRQCRMDRVRDEINRGAVGHGTTTLDVGRRWGVRSRSALSQAYKASFGESPGQTTIAYPNGPAETPGLAT